MTSHDTRGPVTTLHDFGGLYLGQPLDTFSWALTISRSRLLARVCEVGLTRPSCYILSCSKRVGPMKQVGGPTVTRVETSVIPSSSLLRAMTFEPPIT